MHVHILVVQSTMANLLKPYKRKNRIFSAASAAVTSGTHSAIVFLLLSFMLIAGSFARPALFTDMRASAGDMLAPVVQSVSVPVQTVADYAGNVSAGQDLKSENARLRAENERLREWYQTAVHLQAQNESLRSLLNLELGADKRYITARTLADPGSAYVKSLLIAAGRDDGVRPDQAVIAGEGVIGRVIEAGDQTARVLLINDLNSRVPVLIADQNRRAILAGSNDATASLKHLPRDISIEKGARIITSGHGGIFPPGLPVGRVTDTQDGTATVALNARAGDLRYVRVVDSAQNAEFGQTTDPQ